MESKTIQQMQELVYATGSEAGRGLLLSCALLPPAGEALKEDTVYLAQEPTQLLALPESRRASPMVCLFGEEEIDPAQLAIRGVRPLFLGREADLDQAWEALVQALEYSRTAAQLSWRLLNAGNQNYTIQRLVELAHEHMENSIAVFDTSFQLIAYAGTPDPYAQRWMEERYLNREDLERLNSEHVHERAKKSAVPLLIKNKNFPQDRIIAMLDHQRDIGHLAVVEDTRPFTGLDYQMAAVLSSAIRQQMAKDEFTRNAQGFPHEYFLKDLLDRRLVIAPDATQPPDYQNRRFAPACCCLVVETARTPGAVSTVLIRNGFEQLFPGVSTVAYQGQIIVILSGVPQQGVEEEMVAAIRTFCRENRLYCGMSNAFSGIYELPDYYDQALRAIEIGADADSPPGLFCYQDYCLKHLMGSFLRQERASVFCCPQMKRLFECDRRDGRNLAETLYRYLLNGNTAATAASMFIHRNTLLYRLNLINEIVKIDYNDPALRMYLILSYEMMKAERQKTKTDES